MTSGPKSGGIIATLAVGFGTIWYQGQDTRKILDRVDRILRVQTDSLDRVDRILRVQADSLEAQRTAQRSNTTDSLLNHFVANESLVFLQYMLDIAGYGDDKVRVPVALDIGGTAAVQVRGGGLAEAVKAKEAQLDNTLGRKLTKEERVLYSAAETGLAFFDRVGSAVQTDRVNESDACGALAPWLRLLMKDEVIANHAKKRRYAAAVDLYERWQAECPE